MRTSNSLAAHFSTISTRTRTHSPITALADSGFILLIAALTECQQNLRFWCRALRLQVVRFKRLNLCCIRTRRWPMPRPGQRFDIERHHHEAMDRDDAGNATLVRGRAGRPRAMGL